MKAKLKVAVIFNEPNPELYRKPSKKSKKKQNFTPYFEVDQTTPLEDYEFIKRSLINEGYDCYTLNLFDDINNLINDVKKNQPDVIFNFVELYQEDAKLEMNIVGLYELLGIPYTGSPPLALANCQNKMMAKRLLNVNGIKTPPSFLASELPERLKHDLNYPLIVKPAFEDASVGIENESIVKNKAELLSRMDHVFQKFTQPVLIEEFVEGRELNIAVFEDEGTRALPISEIDFTEMPDHLHNIVSYQAKWDPHHESYHKTIPVCPANLPKAIEKKAKETAIKAFKVMECRDYARVDVRLSLDDEIYVLEVNPNPDLTAGAGFMRSAEADGISYSQVLKKLVEMAYARKA
ncbi:MAG: ATP-grasp domain-containing protein [Ignavibacteriaceae bacterium]|nr:ATP-grasp domain-containing protein [Ignavibacteriaceae bacterium]